MGDALCDDFTDVVGFLQLFRARVENVTDPWGRSPGYWQIRVNR